MKLRIVDIMAWINGTYENPQGETFIDVPEGQEPTPEWAEEQVLAQEFEPGTRVLWEYGDLDENESWQPNSVVPQRQLVVPGPGDTRA